MNNKPCPFCQSTSLKFIESKIVRHESHVLCENCNTFFYFGPFMTKLQLQSKWNDRYNSSTLKKGEAKKQSTPCSDCTRSNNCSIILTCDLRVPRVS